MELAFKMAVKLELTETETQYLCLLVQLEQEKDPEFREELSKRLNALNPTRKSHDLTADLFKIISDWYHYAILELTYLAGFKLDEVIYLARVRAVEASRPPDVAGEHRNRDHECSSPAPALIRRRRSAPRQKSR